MDRREAVVLIAYGHVGPRPQQFVFRPVPTLTSSSPLTPSCRERSTFVRSSPFCIIYVGEEAVLVLTHAQCTQFQPLRQHALCHHCVVARVYAPGLCHRCLCLRHLPSVFRAPRRLCAPVLKYIQPTPRAFTNSTAYAPANSAAPSHRPRPRPHDYLHRGSFLVCAPGRYLPPVARIMAYVVHFIACWFTLFPSVHAFSSLFTLRTLYLLGVRYIDTCERYLFNKAHSTSFLEREGAVRPAPQAFRIRRRTGDDSMAATPSSCCVTLSFFALPNFNKVSWP
ncbi:hypothetical protein HYPSUDRAFT_738867 [Hypholoma sublateritium FD-334 SS-4]|uniref:Uncharacterized protein n=1 Tax=Hypholoma sublateritium (strain FD-334 SS-4) TaxID=945553 RepID=A0A0D2L3E9_HYPSF|nr:hypothetical protein HYPSUDRAFT_738867 [Hypholoma sublateritium FD-334 SS-4]